MGSSGSWFTQYSQTMRIIRQLLFVGLLTERDDISLLWKEMRMSFGDATAKEFLLSMSRWRALIMYSCFHQRVKREKLKQTNFCDRQWREK